MNMPRVNGQNVVAVDGNGALLAPVTFFAANTGSRLIEMAAADGYELTAINYDTDGVVTTATALWPDGSAGVFTTLLKNATFLTVDAWTITHADSGKTVTQAAMTRDSNGAVTIKPALTVA